MEGAVGREVSTLVASIINGAITATAAFTWNELKAPCKQFVRMLRARVPRHRQRSTTFGHSAYAGDKGACYLCPSQPCVT